MTLLGGGPGGHQTVMKCFFWFFNSYFNALGSKQSSLRRQDYALKVTFLLIQHSSKHISLKNFVCKEFRTTFADPKSKEKM